ncbi:unnamed protein product [Larinioides sclopetarius]|uniref:CRAL-TRIO domain-containing protein n=1 Tax=Larinioides sclopetarius TaxID=280406 RepID=A0AAV1ZPQ5_9ARAC
MSEGNEATARIDEEILPFELGYLPEYFQKKAALELNETPERKEQSIQELREFLERNKHTTGLIFEDYSLIEFLRVNKYNAVKSFSQIKAYVALRKKNSQLFQNLSYEWLVKTFYDRTLTVLPWRCPDGCTIIIVELENWNPETFPLDQVKKAIFFYIIQALREPMTQVNGIKAIIDVKSTNINHLRYCTPSNLYLIYYGLQIHFHNDPKTLVNFFPKAILPKYYGGDLENFQMWDWLKRSTTREKLNTLGGIRNWPE